MRWSVRLALVAIVLLAAGFGLPHLIPREEDYNYVVHAIDESRSDERDWTVLAYQNLSAEERDVFDAARTGDGDVRREERVNGSHFTHHYDVAGNVAVTYDGQSYAVHGFIVREHFTLRYWSRPFLWLLGTTAGVSALLAFGIESLRTREHSKTG